MELRISIPDAMFSDIYFAPRCGWKIIYVADNGGNVDLARWVNGEWTCELGCCSEITKWAPISI